MNKARISNFIKSYEEIRSIILESKSVNWHHLISGRYEFRQGPLEAQQIMDWKKWIESGKSWIPG